jgi:hypothetical protein
LYGQQEKHEQLVEKNREKSSRQLTYPQTDELDKLLQLLVALVMPKPANVDYRFVSK